MISGPPRPCKSGAQETEVWQIEFVRKKTDDTDQVVLPDPIL